jgi:3-hydroxyacyl-[acyl-carrier-protein] dehydratase
VLEHDPGGRLLALKNVTGSEEFFEGHFPGAPVMPGVLIMESLAQAAGIWLLHEASDPAALEVQLVGIDGAKFRRPVVPGDRLHLEVVVLRRRGSLVRVRGSVTSGEHRVAEAELLLKAVALDRRASIRARASPRRRAGPRRERRPVRDRGARGSARRAHAHRFARGRRRDTEIGEDNHLFPFCSVGLAPQDKKYHGERTRLVIGDGNVIRECVTIQPGTEHGGGLTRIGSRNLFMAYAHVAHDCSSATTPSSRTGDARGSRGGGGPRDHRRVLGGAPVLARRRARVRRRLHGRDQGRAAVLEDRRQPRVPLRRERDRARAPRLLGERIGAIRRAFRALLQSGLNVSDAVAQMERDGRASDVRRLLEFIKSSGRGVISKRRRGGNGDDAV